MTGLSCYATSLAGGHKPSKRQPAGYTGEPAQPTSLRREFKRIFVYGTRCLTAAYLLFVIVIIVDKTINEGA